MGASPVPTEEVALEPKKKRSNVFTVLLMAFIFIFVLGVLAYVGGVITNLSVLSNASETPVILITSLIGMTVAAIIALFRLSKEDR